jgi:hypothetical protein
MEASEKKTSDKKTVPPYVAYTTLSNFIDRFKQGLPSRIDRGLMGSMSGAAQSQVITAMRYLGMTSENGLPTPLMKQYATGDEGERKNALGKMLVAAYPFLFDTEAFNISFATGQQLRETLEANTGATGETLDRCMSFVKDAAWAAGFTVSPYITQKTSRTANGRKKSAPRPRPTPKTTERARQANAANQPQSPAQTSLLLSGLFQRLPKPGTAWSKDERERWVQTLQNVLLLEYPEN